MISTISIRKEELFIKDILESTIFHSITLNISNSLIVDSRMYTNIVHLSTCPCIIDSRINPSIVDSRMDPDIVDSRMNPDIVDSKMKPHIVDSRISGENLSWGNTSGFYAAEIGATVLSCYRTVSSSCANKIISKCAYVIKKYKQMCISNSQLSINNHTCTICRSYRCDMNKS